MSLPLNRPATGAPVITGPATVGQELAVDVTGIEDEDGLHDIEYTYQWVRVDADGTSNEEDITDATADTYTLTDDDLGKKVKIEVSFADDFGSDEQRTSAPTDTVTAASTNNAPVFTPSDVSRSIAENPDVAGQNIGDPVTATDADAGDTLTYTLGGDDAASFDIIPSSGQIRTQTNVSYSILDFEAKSTYKVTVTATDTSNATAVATVTISVTDVDEPPSAPATPAVSAVSGSTTSLTVSWAAPANAGKPAIDSYDVQYRAGTSGTWIDGPENVTTTTTTIASLVADTLYEVQVRATNAEGDSVNAEGNFVWSDPPGSGRTNSPPETVPGVTVSPTALPVTEEDTTGARYTVVLDTQPTANVTVTVAGHAGTDVTPSPTSLTFTSTTWGTAQTVTVTAGDDADTANDAVTLTHSAASTDTGYEGITIDGVAVTVTDNDTAPGVTVSKTALTVTEEDTTGASYTVVLDSQPTATVTVTVAGHAGTDVTPSPTSLTFTTTTWGTAQTVTVTAGDDADTANDAVTLTHSAASTDTGYEGISIDGVAVTVTDNDAAKGVTVSTTALTVTEEDTTGDSYTVVLDSQPTATVTVTVAGHAGTDVTPSPTSLTFTTTTWGTAQTVTVTAGDDADTANDAVTLTHSAASTDTGYEGISIDGVAVTVTDNDAAKGVTVSTTALTVTEEDTTGDSYTVVLDSQPTATVTVTVAGHAGTDVTPSPTSLTFTTMTWDTAQTVTVTAGADADAVNDSVALTHSAASTDSDYQGITIAGVAVTVTDNDDNDTPPGVTVSKAALTVTEEDTIGASYTVVLDSQPTANVTVTVAGHAGTDVTLTPSSATLTFTPMTWGTAQTVTVTAGHDADTANDSVSLTHSAASPDSNYQGITIAGVAVTVRDNDAANTPATGAPTITGTAQVGETLTAVTTGIMDADGLTSPTYTYQWIRVAGAEADIAGANSSTYTLGAADLGKTLKVRVTFDDDASHTETLTSAATATVTTTTVTTPGAPQNLSWAPGDEQVTLRWDAPASDGGAAIIRYEYETDDSGTWIDAGTDRRVTVTGLTNGQPYTFAVRAVNAAGGGPAATVTATPVTTPGAPQNLSWAPGDGQVTLSWDAPSSDGGAAITRYEYETDDSGTWIDADLDLQETVPDLANGQPYTFAVRAMNAAGDGPAATVTATPVTTPGAPENLGWAPGDGQVTLSWDAPSSDGGAAIARYEYEIDDSGTWIDADLDLQETVPDLTNGQPYTFAVRAVNAAGGSPAAAVTATPATTPGAPENLGWAPGDGQVTLSWDAPSSDGGAAITRYEYEIDDSGTWIDAGLDLQETVPDLANGQPYTFAVRAMNAAGDGPATTVTATPVTTPGAPENLGWAPGDGQVTLSWDAPSSDGGAAITRYEYEIDDSGTWIDADLDLQETVPGLTNGQPYTFTVRAVNAAGGGDAAAVTATPATTPGAPENLGWAPGDGQVTLSWDAPSSDGGAAITRYEYEIDDSGTWIDAGLDLQETVPGLTNGQPYTFALRAVNAAGGGDAATVTATPVTTPGAPQNLSWVAGYEQVTLNWDAPSSDGGAAITRYEYAIDDSGTWIDTGADREVTVTGLTNGQPYAFAVRAVNAVGGGDVATVTIVSADPLPQAWLARFGRAAADHVVEAVSDRWRDGPAASHLTIGGRQAGDLFDWTGLGGQAARDTADDRGDPVRTGTSSTRPFAPFGGADTSVGGTVPGMTMSVNDMNRAPVGPGAVDREAGAAPGGHAAQGALLGALGLPDPRALTDLRALLTGSSFLYTGAQEEDGRAPTPGWLGEWSAWGRTATSRFSGADGELSLDGEVASAMLGFDSHWDRWLAGVVVSHSAGRGAYTHPTATSGVVTSSLTALHPYAHFALNERTNFWSVLGYGVGALSLKPEGSATAFKTDLTNAMAAFGGRTALSVRSARAGRFELAILSDARLTNTASDAAAGLAGAVGRTSRVRMMLEGSGSMPLAESGMLRPTLEAGVRYDAGDAETGAGLEVGGGLGYAAGRLSVEVNARGLLAHQDAEYGEWGFSGSIAYTPSADGRGLSTRIGSTWGATQSGVQSLWSRQDTSGLVRNTAFDGAQRYQAELRYGLDGLQGRARWAPYIGVESGGRSSQQALRQGVTLTLGRGFDAELELGRRQVGPGADPEHAVQLRGTLRW